MPWFTSRATAAAALGLYTQRGQHAKERRGVTALAAAISRPADRNRPFVIAVMLGLLSASEDSP